MKDLSTGKVTPSPEPIDDAIAQDSMSPSGDASEAQLRTMDVIVTQLDDISQNVLTMSSIMATASASDSEASLSRTNVYLASIRDSIYAMSLQDMHDDANTVNANIATETTLQQIEKLVAKISQSIDTSSATFKFKFEGDATVMQQIAQLMRTLSETDNTKKLAKNAANINAALEAVTPGIEGLANALMVTEERSKDGDLVRKSIDSGLLGAIKAFLDIMADKSKLMQAKDNAALFGTVIKELCVAVSTAMQEFDKADDWSKNIETFARLVEKLDKTMTTATKTVVTVALVTGGIVLAFRFIDYETIAKASIGFPAVCAGIAAGIALISLAVNKLEKKSLTDFAWSIGIISMSAIALSLLPVSQMAKGALGVIAVSTALGVGLWAVNKLTGPAITEFGKNATQFGLGVLTMSAAMLVLTYGLGGAAWSVIAKGALALLATATVLSAAMWLMPKKQIVGFGWSVLALTASLLVLGFALPYFEEQTRNIETATWFKAGAVLVALAGSVALANSTMKAGSGKAAAIEILAIVGALAVMPWVIKQYESITWEQMTKPAVVITALTAAVVIVGKFGPVTYAGAGALVVMAASVVLLAHTLPQFDNVSWETLAKAGACVVGLTAATVALGYVSPMALLGSAALLVMSGAVTLLSYGLKQYPFDITLKQYSVMALGLGELAAAFALIGNPFTIAFILSGAAAGASIGAALYSLGRGLKKASEINFDKTRNGATAIINWARDTCKTIAEGMSLKDILKAKLAMGPIYDLGGALKNIADAVIDMANGTYNVYEVDENGNAKVVAVRQIGPEQYAAFATSVQQLIDGITEPLTKFGAGGGWFAKSDTEKGIDALKNIGDIVQPMIDVATNIDALQKADFSIIGPRFRDFFGVNDDGSIQNNGLIAVLQGIGKTDDSWFSDSDLENGIEAMEGIDKIVTPFVEIAKNAKEVKETDFKAFSQGLLELKPAIEAYADFDATLPDSFKFANNLTTITKAFAQLDKYKNNMQFMKEIAEAIDSIANVNLTKLRTVKSEAAKELFKRLDKVEAWLKKIEDNTSPDTKLSHEQLQLNDDGTFKQDFNLHAGQQVDIVTIALMLNQIKNLLLMQTRRPAPTTK